MWLHMYVYILETEGMLRCVTWIELVESHEALESNHRGYLIDTGMSDYFAGELVEGDARAKKC